MIRQKTFWSSWNFVGVSTVMLPLPSKAKFYVLFRAWNEWAITSYSRPNVVL